jgi:hypothetical protein
MKYLYQSIKKIITCLVLAELYETKTLVTGFI